MAHFAVSPRVSIAALGAALLLSTLHGFPQPPHPASQAPASSITGAVTLSTDHAPVSGITVRVRALSTKTDGHGRYHLKNLPPGVHQVTVGERGRSSIGYLTRTVSLAPGEDLRNLDFSLEPKATISGTVTDADGKPLARAEVALLAREYCAGEVRYFRRNNAFTNARGEYRIVNVLPGIPYHLVARERLSRLGFAPDPPPLDNRPPVTIPTYYPGSAQREGSGILVLRPGETLQATDIRMLTAPSRCVEGGLTHNGAPAAIDFFLHPADLSFGIGPNGGTTGAPPQGKSREDGSFRVCGLPPGDYRFTSLTGDFNSPGSLASQLLHIGNSDLTGVTLQPLPRILIGGEVTLHGASSRQQEAPQFRMGLSPLHRWFGDFSTLLQAEIPGPLTLAGEHSGVLADEYYIKLLPLPEGYYLQDIRFGAESLLDRPFRPASGLPGAQIHVQLGADGGFLHLQAADSQGRPVGGANVILLPESAQDPAAVSARWIRGQTLQDGTYRSPALPPVTHYAIVLPPGELDLSAATVDRIWAARTRAAKVEIPPKSTRRLTLTPLDLN